MRVIAFQLAGLYVIQLASLVLMIVVKPHATDFAYKVDLYSEILKL